jgi:dihydrofolate reductase
MKKIILDLAVTLDGFIEGPNGEIDWCILDQDMDFEGFLSGIDTIFYGRASYDAWGNYRPEADAVAEKKLWESVHSKNKVVFTSRPPDDGNALFIYSDISTKVAEIKQQKGKDIWLYGGAGLIKTFIELELVDVYRISVHPTVLGKGKPLFEDLKSLGKENLCLKILKNAWN